MEESKEKLEERKIKKDHTMWFVILIGILVIMLACTFIYIWKLKNTTETITNTGEILNYNLSSEIKKEYTTNLTDASNGKLAFLKLLERNALQTEKHEGYYTYIDEFENKYNIKEIKNVTSEKGIMGVDNWASLFKVTVTYSDHNDKTNTMNLAILLLPNHEVQNMGTYDNYTGTTSFLKGFSNLYESENENKISKEDKEEVEETIKQYYKLLSKYEQNPILMLTDELKMNVQAVQDPDTAPKEFFEHPNSYKYVWTGIKYEDFRGETWYLSDEIIKNKFTGLTEYKKYLFANDTNIAKSNNKLNYNIESIKFDDKSTEHNCICKVKTKKNKKEYTNTIVLTRGNGNFVISNVK